MTHKQVILKKSEKEQLEEYLSKITAGQIMMREGAMLKSEADKLMWKKIKEICPNASRFHHPIRGK